MKSIELFAGIGGIALAAEWAGIETVAFCERELYCQKVLNKHWPDVPIFDDIRTLNKKALVERGIDVGAIELVTGGFPCQPYSVAGKRKGTEDDRDLWPEMFRVIEEIRPTWVVGENVANFAKMELDRTLFDLESIGYQGRAIVLPAVAVGAHHRRDRIFIIAYADCERCMEYEGQQEKVQQNRDKGLQREESKQSFLPKSIYSSNKTMADPSSVRLSRQRKSFEPVDSKKNETGETSEPFNVCIGGEWAVEPDVGRVAYGVSDRMDRLIALGNAVVPQQIYPIFETIMKIERGEIASESLGAEGVRV